MNPGLWTAAAAAGLAVRELPLMVRRSGSTQLVPDGCAVRMLDADDGALPAVLAAIGVGFGHPDTAVGNAGPGTGTYASWSAGIHLSPFSAGVDRP